MSTAQAAKPPTQLSQYQRKVMGLRDYLEARKSQLAQVAPKTLTVERALKIAIQACAKTPDLLNCSIESIYLAVHQAVQMGLEPGGPLGGAYLVPFKKQCVLVVGYRGLIDLARRSGQIVSIEAHVVHEKDQHAVEFGLEPQLKHVPYLGKEDPGDLLLVYAVAKLKDGGVQAEVMTRAQVERIRDRSPTGGKSGPWKTDFEEMARKTVVRRLCKYLPLTVELAQALETDPEEGSIDVPFEVAPPSDGEEVPADDVPALPESKTERLADELRAREKEPAAGEPRPVVGGKGGVLIQNDEPEPGANG